MNTLIGRLIAIVVTTTVAACGGTGGGGSAAPGSLGGTGALSVGGSSSTKAASSSSTAAVASSAAPFNSSIVWTPVPSTPGTVTVISPDNTIDANAVVTFGQAFPAGEIPSGQFVQASLSGSALPTQTVVKRRHPDGSIRHAILSVRLPATSVAASSKASLALTLAATGSNASGTALTLSDVTGSSTPEFRVEILEKSVLANGTTPASEAGSYWNVEMKSALAGSTDVWLSGALTSEWRARVAPVNSGVEHPGLRVIFDSRFQSATQGRVSITMENVESNAARGDRIYDLRVYKTTGATSELVYSGNNIKHYAHTRFRKIFYFGSGSEEMLAIADTARLKSSRAIPNYAEATISESSISTAYSSWLSSQRGLYQPASIQPYMPSTGGRWDIGPLPGWTAKAVISGDPRMYQVMLDHAERAGFWNVHWRDSLLSGATLANADVFSVDNHPNFSLVNPSSAADSYVGSTHMNWMGDSLPAPVLPFAAITGTSGGYVYTMYYDTAHEPSLTFVPYIVTGDRFYLDELSFYAAWPMIYYGYTYRGNAQGLYKADPQVRGQAWGLRTLGHAAWIMPDGDWRKTYFDNKVTSNLNWYRTVNMVDAPLGWVSANVYNTSVVPYAVPSKVANVYAPWQHSFMSYTLAELAYKGFNAADVRDWVLGLSVKFFTSADGDYNKYDGTAYYLVNKINSGGSTVTLSTMAQVSQYSFETRGAAPTSLDGTYAGGSAMMAFMALATAVDAGVTNSSQGFVFLRNQIMATGTSNIRAIQDEAIFNIVPFGAVTGISVAPGIYTP